MKPQKSNPLKILFISAEVAPFAKVGGLADVAGALPQALRELGADIRIMMPLYGSIKKHSLNRSATVPCGDCGEAATSPNLSHSANAPGRLFARRGTKTIECAGEKYPLKKIIKNFKVDFDGEMESVNVYETFINTPSATSGSIVRDSRNENLGCGVILQSSHLGSTARSLALARLRDNGAAGGVGFNVPVYFIENKKFFGGNKVYDPSLPKRQDKEGDDKFLFFSKAAADIVTSLNPDGACPVSTTKRGTSPSSFRVISRSNSRPFAFTPDIIHCNDNHTALMPVLLNSMSGNFARRDGACSVSTIGKKIKTVLTIHNMEYQGKFSPMELKKIKLAIKGKTILAKDSKDGDINKMVQGILSADAVTTVSPTYAKEILTKEYGEGLENILKMRKKDLYGILNGIDTEKFNPENDPLIQYNYSTKDLTGKIKCKEELIGEYFKGVPSPLRGGLGIGFLRENYTKLNKLGLKNQALTPPSPPLWGIKNNPPLIGLVSRLTPQKGIDLVIEAIPKLFKTRPETLFILLGTGLPEYEKKLEELGRKYPANFRPLISFDVKIAQLIYAASDIFLMPSKFEPCGLGQLIAMRYGSVPAARKIGGLADTIEQFKVQSSKFKVNANGFLFEKYSSDAMLKCLDEALILYHDKKIWKKIMLNGMRRDSSWVKSAKEYMKIYKKLSGKSLRDKK